MRTFREEQLIEREIDDDNLSFSLLQSIRQQTCRFALWANARSHIVRQTWYSNYQIEVSSSMEI